MFTGCVNEEDDLFSESAADRLEHSRVTYTERLIDSPAGWAMEYYLTTDTFDYKAKGYLLLADFNSDGSVKVGMNNAFSNNQYLEDTSLWEVITDNGPVLTFNTYNSCIHCFSDPNDLPESITGNSRDETGLGAEGDYEFIMVDVPENGDSMIIKGKKRGTYVRMYRLEEGTDFNAYLTDVNKFRSDFFSASLPSHAMMHIGDTEYNLTDADTGIMTLYAVGADAVQENTTHPFLITKRHGRYYLRLRDAITAGNEEIQEFFYDESSDRFVGIDNTSYIYGYPIMSFVEENISSKTVSVGISSNMSDKMKDVFDRLDTELRGRNQTFSSFNLSVDNGANTAAWVLRYNQGRGSVRYNYNMTIDKDAATMSFTYTSPGTNGENLMNLFPSLREAVNMFSQSFTVSPAINTFDYRRLRLTSVADPELWFEISIN